ncbi:hypothetical protein [Nocardia sp. CA-290969]|uniref:hypothetical protein n=1 Tax=Nocardia sp. CA-290969 TaxID=3239986 RepID=UPI003D900148
MNRPHPIVHGSSLRERHIHRVDGLYLLTRRAPMRNHRFTDIHGIPPLSFDALADAGFVIGSGTDRERAYRLEIGVNDIELLDRRETDELCTALGRWGTALAVLHSISPDREIGEPPARTRFRQWWRNGDELSIGRRGARERFLKLLTDTSRDFVDVLLSTPLDTGPTVLLHGWARLGQSMTAPDRTRFLLGEDIGAGPPEFDLATLVAELIERAVIVRSIRIDAVRAAHRTLLAAYEAHGTVPLSEELVDGFIVEALARHVGDFITFAQFDAGWDRVGLEEFAQLINRLVDDGGSNP